MTNKITQEEFNIWKHNPTTKRVFELLTKDNEVKANQVVNSLLNIDLSVQKIDVEQLKNRINVIQSREELIDIDFSVINQIQEEDNDK